jgi:predicted ATPase/class 3 adenylate cyclase
MAEQPTGTVTLLFSDIEGSTALLQRLGTERYAEALDLHRRLLRAAFDRHGSYEVDYEGDAFFVVFRSAQEAVAAAAEAQQALADADWPDGSALRVRMGIHTGEPLVAPPKYVGLDVHKAARVMAAAHGGQVLLTKATGDLLHANVAVRELGTHRLKDLLQPEPLYQLLVPGLREEFPALKTLGNRPTNLPVVATPFIGRERELEAVQELLLRDGLRLLTLTGPGGIGKTRLALQAAADASDRFRDGVYWMPFAPVRDEELVAATAAQALGLREEPNEPIEETLSRYLADKELLLVLDNLEHLVEAARRMAATVLRAAPEVRLLTTTREALRISGEQLYEVPPLALPAELGQFEQNDAVRLFVARAQTADPAFELTAANAPAVVEIVRRLEGLPLAIELAAARIRALPPGALLERLDDRLRVLTAGPHDADERQRTLSATIEWSYDLLPRAEQLLFARLAIFVSGCRLDAAEAVCDPDRKLGIEVLDGIESLLDKSLVRRRQDSDGQPRYWMLEAIRDYALEKANAADLRSVRDSHAVFFAEFARVARNSFGEAPSQWSERLESEQANLRAAHRWSLAAGRADHALDLAIAYAILRALRGPMSEGRRVLVETLEIADAASSALRHEAMRQMASLAERQGDLVAARRYASASLELGRAIGDRRAIGRSLLTLGIIEGDAGEEERSELLQREALDLFEASGCERDARQAMGMLGFLLISQQRYDEAATICERALNLSRIADDPRGVGTAASNLGHVRARQGATDEALDLQREALRLMHELHDVQGVAEVLLDVSALAIEVGAGEAAATFLGGIRSLARTAQFSLTAVETQWYDETIERLTQSLGSDHLQQVLVAAATLDCDELVARAAAFFDGTRAARGTQHPAA